MHRYFLARAACVAASFVVAGCVVGPDYRQPNAVTPLAYKELPAPLAGWQLAKPDDGVAHGAWWEVFGDPSLSGLEARVRLDNQNIAQAEANYRATVAVIAEQRAGYFPTIGANGGIQYQRGGTRVTTSGTAEATASWNIDVWGRVRRSVESARATAQASAADLANATLSAQGSVGTLYFQLCYQDALQALLRQTADAYRRALTITTNQAQFGVAAPSDVITAQTQLDSAESQMIAAGVARAQDEHAIAVLVGVPPTDIGLPTRNLASALPQIPVAVPSVLLQRRPDVAAAERNMQAQNAQIGVAVAAYYPALSLSGLLGAAGSPLNALFSAANEVWSIGFSVSQTVFDGGLRGAEVDAARANYDAAVATYRQTVLTAFQQVEDNLSGLRILAQQAAVQARATADAKRAVAIALNEYEAGTQNYTAVVQAQAILLGDQETDLQIELTRLTDTVALIQALGGGWDAAELPEHPLRVGQGSALDPLGAAPPDPHS